MIAALALLKATRSKCLADLSRIRSNFVTEPLRAARGDEFRMEETENQSDGASARQTRVSFWDRLGWSVILGLILMIIAFIGHLIETNQRAQFPGLAGKMVWSVSVCLALAYGKVVSKADPDKTALAGLGGVGVASCS